MKTKLVLFIILLFVIGCTSTEKKGAQPDDGAIVIDVNSALKGEGRSIGDMVESVRIVPLETTEASVLNQFPKSVIVTGNYIFVEDFQQNGVELLMFDKDGKFIKKFQRGNGPGEFNILNNIAYDGKNLYVFDYSKILRYSVDGQFIDSKDFDCRMMYMTKFGDGFVAIQRETQSIDHKFKMFKIDSDLKLVAEHILDPFSYANFWGATEYNSTNANYWVLEAGGAYLNLDDRMYGWFAVRCLQDYSTEP